MNICYAINRVQVYGIAYQLIQRGSSSLWLQYIYSDDALYKVEPSVITLSSSTVTHAVGAKGMFAIFKLLYNVRHMYINK